MKIVIYFLILLITFIIILFFLQKSGSDPTMDYSTLQGSGMSPQDYDALVKQRQAQYDDAKNEDEDV